MDDSTPVVNEVERLFKRFDQSLVSLAEREPPAVLQEALALSLWGSPIPDPKNEK